ncbi:hypothetical protein BDP27DRAFT_1420259 [Rhodocollybia butyracea]|uniref:Uncharacterized protein n=1 Tax=Rhodocollybia butyracea TaxID=206335 RepID=A0A9P5PVT0_9AGAR|nr:hypothetical protein BDP27DRAFT_1420259 [Rhodocollybia butyracea]
MQYKHCYPPEHSTSKESENTTPTVSDSQSQEPEISNTPQVFAFTSSSSLPSTTVPSAASDTDTSTSSSDSQSRPAAKELPNTPTAFDLKKPKTSGSQPSKNANGPEKPRQRAQYQEHISDGDNGDEGDKGDYGDEGDDMVIEDVMKENKNKNKQNGTRAKVLQSDLASDALAKISKQAVRKVTRLPDTFPSDKMFAWEVLEEELVLQQGDDNWILEDLHETKKDPQALDKLLAGWVIANPIYNAIWESIDRIWVNSPLYFDFLEKKTYERMRAPSQSLLSVQTFDYDALSSFAESEEKKNKVAEKEAKKKKEEAKKPAKKNEETKKAMKLPKNKEGAKKPAKKNEETKKAMKLPKNQEGAKKPAKPVKKREEEEKLTKRKPEARIPEIASKKAENKNAIKLKATKEVKMAGKMMSKTEENVRKAAKSKKGEEKQKGEPDPKRRSVEKRRINSSNGERSDAESNCDSEGAESNEAPNRDREGFDHASGSDNDNNNNNNNGNGNDNGKDNGNGSGNDNGNEGSKLKHEDSDGKSSHDGEGFNEGSNRDSKGPGDSGSRRSNAGDKGFGAVFNSEDTGTPKVPIVGAEEGGAFSIKSKAEGSDHRPDNSPKLDVRKEIGSKMGISDLEDVIELNSDDDVDGKEGNIQSPSTSRNSGKVEEQDVAGKKPKGKHQRSKKRREHWGAEKSKIQDNGWKQ